MDTHLDQEQTLRTEIYLVLSALFRSAPSEEVIDFLKTLDIEASESAMQKAWIAMVSLPSHMGPQMKLLRTIQET